MAKAIFAIVLFVAAATGAIAAWGARKLSQSFLAFAQAFAGGALLGAALLHALADAISDWGELGLSAESDKQSGEEESESYPWPELLCTMGCLGTHGLEVAAKSLWQHRDRAACSMHRSPQPQVIGPHVVQGEGSTELEQEDTFGRQVSGEGAFDRQDSGEGAQFKLSGVHALEEIQTEPSFFMGPLLMLVLSMHSLLEGLSLGASSPAHAMDLFLAIFAHKGVAGFALGMSWLSANNGGKTYIIAMLWFSCVTPLGVFMGQPVEGSLFAVIVRSFSAGTFLYIGLIEGCPGVHAPWVPGAACRQAALYLLGFVVMAILALWM